MSEPTTVRLQVNARVIADLVNNRARDARAAANTDQARGQARDEAPLWTLTIPDPGTGFLTSNAARRNTWHVNRRVVATWRRAAKLHALADRTLPRLQSAHIVVIAHHADTRRRDAANLAPTAKACVDGLIDAHLLPDDDDTHLDGPDLRTGAPVGRRGRRYLEVLVYRRTTSGRGLGGRR